MSNLSKNLSISVVLPAHNEEKIISRAIAGILCQTDKPNEVIIVDNNSTDQTGKIALSFKSDFRKKKIKYTVLSEPKLGSALARNKGFFAVSSAIIASCDADTVPHQDWIWRIRRHFREFDSVAVSGISVIKDSSLLVRIISELNWYKYLTFFLRSIFGFQTINTANAAVRKDVFEKISGFNTNCLSPNDLDDTELSSRLCQYGAIRVDTRIRADGSFRRYQPFSKAIKASICRLGVWVKISRNTKQNKPGSCSGANTQG